MKKNLRIKLIKFRKNKYFTVEAKTILNIFKLIKKKYGKPQIIGGYIPINYEFDCLNLLKIFEKKNYTICIPKIKKNYQMDFYKYSFKKPLKINKLGIPEAIKTKKKFFPDIIFVPLVAYDSKLSRLGYGGGFYDRYFERYAKKKKIIKIGLAFSFQKIKKLPVNKFDKKLDRIITEKKI